jgi:hypothetical protein
VSKASVDKLVRSMAKGIEQEKQQGERYWQGSDERNRLAQVRKNRKRKVRR